MTQSSSDLSQELVRISDRFSHLGERLLSTARQLQAPGNPPPEGLIVELGEARRDFLALRDRAVALAEALHVTLPSAETLDTIQGLTAVLDLVAEAEVRQLQAEELRRRAASVLGRVLSLQHCGEDEFSPLRECQDQAQTLRESVLAGAWTSLPAEVELLAEGDHPFANLVKFVEDRESLHDDHWTSLHDSIGASFGRSLAAAAARARLVLPPVSSDSDPHAAAPADDPNGYQAAGTTR